MMAASKNVVVNGPQLARPLGDSRSGYNIYKQDCREVTMFRSVHFGKMAIADKYGAYNRRLSPHISSGR